MYNIYVKMNVSILNICNLKGNELATIGHSRIKGKLWINKYAENRYKYFAMANILESQNFHKAKHLC